MTIPQLVGPRRALSLLVLGFATTMFVLVALARGGAWARCFVALAITYGVAFFALASGWFWGRWYAMGLAASGITMAVLGLVTSGWNPGLGIWGGLHLLIYCPLLGEAMESQYEGQEAWRRRYSLDEHGVARIKRAVKGAATALPTLIFFTLAPRDGAGWAALALPLAALGLVGVLRMRFWGVALLATGAVAALTGALGSAELMVAKGPALSFAALGAIAAAALAWAVLPFVGPATRFLRRQVP